MDRITRVVAKDGTATVYTYDENGNRKAATFANGVKVTYEYDAMNRLLVQKTVDSTGALIARYQYTTGKAYGELTEKTGETENHFLYTGEYYDGVSGLYYLRARYMSPETGTFISMDTWQGDLYEPVTLHKYLYANANPVKYKDPSGMFSLPECNIASAIGAELFQNQNVILGMSLLNGIGKTVMTGLCGGDAGDMTEAFLEGMIEGAAMGMLFCAAAAVLATSMLTVMMAHTAASSVVSIVLAIYSVSEGDYLNALVYGAVAVAGIIGVCRWWKVTYQVDYVGEKGIARFAGGSGEETTNLYRVMSEAEYDSLMSNKKFVPYDRAMEEKWFATTQGDAIKWADIFYPDGDYRMVEVTINTNYLQEMYYNQHLDNIGPAYCSSLEVLEKAIKSIRGVK